MNSNQQDVPQSDDPPDWIGALREQTLLMTGALDTSTDVLNVQMDINPDERILLELLDGVTDARECLQDVLDLLDELAGSEYAPES